LTGLNCFNLVSLQAQRSRLQYLWHDTFLQVSSKWAARGFNGFDKNDEWFFHRIHVRAWLSAERWPRSRNESWMKFKRHGLSAMQAAIGGTLK